MEQIVTATAITVIQYVGEPGVTQDCVDGVARFIQFGDRITHTQILTARNSHALLLTIGVGDLVAVKSGFSSGYDGEGPTGFSLVIQLLDTHGSEIEEYEIEDAVLERLDNSALSAEDFSALENTRPIRPIRWHDYVQERHDKRSLSGTLWRDFPPVIPFSIIDPRISDLAIRFWDSPDDCLLTAYRRLEDTVRDRTGLEQHGTKLFSEAFHGATAILQWPDIDAGEQAGRANLFVGTYGAFRNPRAHRELSKDSSAMLAEFLALNQLFRLECEAQLPMSK